MLVTESCLTLCDPMDYTVHGILQARILEWEAFPFSRGSPNPRMEPRSPSLQAILYQLSCQGLKAFPLPISQGLQFLIQGLESRRSQTKTRVSKTLSLGEKTVTPTEVTATEKPQQWLENLKWTQLFLHPLKKVEKHISYLCSLYVRWSERNTQQGQWKSFITNRQQLVILKCTFLVSSITVSNKIRRSLWCKTLA